jgi:hypothetical protein
VTPEEIKAEIKRLAVELDNLGAASFDGYYATTVSSSMHTFYRGAGDTCAESLQTLTRFLKAHK